MVLSTEMGHLDKSTKCRQVVRSASPNFGKFDAVSMGHWQTDSCGFSPFNIPPADLFLQEVFLIILSEIHLFFTLPQGQPVSEKGTVS